MDITKILGAKYWRALMAPNKIQPQEHSRGGDGSHYKATWPKNEKSITIPSKLPKQVLDYVLKEIENYSGINWEEI